MTERFRQVLEEASKQVKEWPEWKKSEALRQSEQALESIAQGKDEDSKAKPATAGK